MRYAIANTSGQWWTGSCWGAEQAKETYASIADCPVTLPFPPGDGAEMEICTTCDHSGYYDTAVLDDYDCHATVVAVGGRRNV